MSKIFTIRKNSSDLSKRIILAPMAQITDLPFRILARKQGAAITYSEMINANAVIRHNKSTIKLGKIENGSRPTALQLFGTNPKTIKKAAEILIEQHSPDIIDFNFACPARQIVEQGAGSALLKRPGRIKEIVETLSALDVETTSKIRLGLTPRDIKEKLYLKTAAIIEKAGSNALIVHARTKDQGYSGTPYIETIKEIKESISIPVVGNGNVIDGKSAVDMFDKTNCDYIAVGRASIGNPFIFRTINHYLETGEKEFIPLENFSIEKIESFFEYLELLEKHEFTNFPHIKRQALGFCKGIRYAKELKLEIAAANSKEEIVTAMTNRLNEINKNLEKN